MLKRNFIKSKATKKPSKPIVTSTKISGIDEVILGLLEGKDLEKEVRRIYFSKEADEEE